MLICATSEQYQDALMAWRSVIAMPEFLWACMHAQRECYGCAGYSHLTGGYPGGQAQYARVPYGMPACVHLASWLHAAY